MAKYKIPLLCFCAEAASFSVSLPTLISRQANGAVSASSFLRRAFQSSAILDGRVYIDGGDFSYTHNNDTVYQYSDTLISIDLMQEWTNSSVNLHSSSKPDGVPSLNNGGIWTDLRNNIMYTGFAGINSFFGNSNTSPQGLWSFSPDRNGGGSWQNLNGTADATFVNQPRPFDGSVASGDGSGYFLGGVAGNSSNFQNSPRGMLAYDLSSQQATYSSGSSTATGTQDGGMVFVPYFGILGIIISAGGQRLGSGGGGNSGNGPNGGGVPGGGGQNGGLASFSTVQVYNPQDQKWYDQKTSGTAPSGRMQFCMTGMPSNNQTYEIFVYAGWDGNFGSASVSFDDAYVLTLPGFYWVKANYTAANPRYGLSCNAVGGGQIITIGGVDPTQQQQQQQNGNAQDAYSAPFSTPDPFTQGLGVFDLGSLSWKTSYSPMPFLYSPAAAVQDYYNTNGRKPTSGFASSSLQTLFAQTDFNNPDDLPFPGGGPGGYGNNNSNAGAIAGGVVGGLAAVSAAAALFIWLKRRYQQKQNRTSDDDDDDEEDELQDQTQQNTLRNIGASGNGNGNGDDTHARMEHANSSSRYPYSPTGFYYNQPQLPEIGTSMAAIPGAAAGTSAAAEAYASAAGEKQPPPAYEERESTPTGGSGGAGGRETVHELPLSEAGAGAGAVSESNRTSTILGVGAPADGIDTVVDGMRPPQEHQHQQPQVPELHEETSGRAELP